MEPEKEKSDVIKIQKNQFLRGSNELTI